MLSSSLLLCGLLLAGPDASDDAVFHMPSLKFELPVNVQANRQYDIKELILHVSPDGTGARWERGLTITPDKPRFGYTATREGMHLFAVQTVYKSGQMDPPVINASTPTIKVMVDMTRPEIQLQAQRNGDSIRVHWKLKEDHPDKQSLHLEYQFGDSPGWMQAAFQPGWEGDAEIPCPGGGPVRVQMTLKDRAGNKGQATAVVPAAMPSPGPLPPEPEPVTNRELRPPPSDSFPRVGDLIPPGQGGVTASSVYSGAIGRTSGFRSGLSGPNGLPGSLPRLVITNRPVVALEFDVMRWGPSGLGSVDVWVTYDDGQTWEPSQTNEPLHLPHGELPPSGSIRAGVNVKIPRPEVICGIYLVVKSKVGVSLEPPQHGTIPQLRVELDTRAPEAVLNPHKPGGDSILILRWTAQDKNLEPEPITWEYAVDPTGPWKLIGPGALPNQPGQYEWRVTSDVPGQVFLRLTVRDQAGNMSVAVTPRPVIVDTVTPIIGPVSLRPVP